jgi:PAS domain S-box-containing protein
VEFNAVFAELIGYEPEEILGLNYQEITPKKWRHVEKTILQDQVMKRGYSDVYEKQYIRKDGTRCPVEIRTYLIRDETGSPQGMWAIIRDISGRKKMEKELMRVQTLESLGTLAGGIAHDFNNLLAAILTSISFARRYGELSEEVTEVLVDAEKVTMRARGLTYQLLSFAKGGEPVKKAVSVPRLLRETAEFALSGSNVKCTYRLPADLWPLDAEEGQIGQVIQNLIINSDQAMPEGGKIHVRANNVHLGIGEILNLAAGAYVKISIRDTGHGIPRKQLPKIFDLFFTTKGRGRGMGLATAFMAVNRHNGHIQAESSQGEGTTFHIFLPASGEKHPEAQEEKKAALGGTGRLLLIDDEPIIRKSAGRVLERLGYQVTLAGDGKEGLELYEKSKKAGRPFDLVITDLTIPGGMGGKEMIKKLKKKHPDARVIVSSGYSEDPIMSEYWKHGIQAVVAKPYLIEKLAETVRKVMTDRET